MLRRVVIVLSASLLVVPGLTAAAAGPPSFSLPDQASEVAPGVFFLGHAVQDGVALVGYAYARQATADEGGRRANAKPPGTPGGGGGNGGGGGGGEETDPASCYSYIANGSKWNTPESYLLNPANIGGVDVSGANDAFGTWEAAAGTNIVGSGATTNAELVADTSGTDGLNEIYFASITDANVLGYAIVWSTRSRGPFVGQIVEADMVIDSDAEWSWYTGANAGGIVGGQIDFWSVFAHEAGHWVGMGHTDTTELCTEQTMYPSISSGDSDKRVLGVGDEAGVLALYP